MARTHTFKSKIYITQTVKGTGQVLNCSSGLQTFDEYNEKRKHLYLVVWPVIIVKHCMSSVEPFSM